jgi:hypothetical protein
MSRILYWRLKSVKFAHINLPSSHHSTPNRCYKKLYLYYTAETERTAPSSRSSVRFVRHKLCRLYGLNRNSHLLLQRKGFVTHMKYKELFYHCTSSSVYRINTSNFSHGHALALQPWKLNLSPRGVWLIINWELER